MEELMPMVKEFEEKFDDFEKRHEEYTKLNDKVKSYQNTCEHDIRHYRRYMKMLKSKLTPLEASADMFSLGKLSAIKSSFDDKANILQEMEDTLPKQNGLYLRIILGTVNVSITSKQDKFEYKNNYENFKITVSAVISIYALFLYFFNQYHLLEALFHFLMVWYYCTLTIREKILQQSGSRIKGWWASYHFILTAMAAVILIWPNSRSYLAFRDQYMLYSFYICIVQCIQYYYQVGCLYKLRALGERPSMDITVDGYMSWMSSRLSFLLVFLLGAYALQANCAYKLYTISQSPYCREWQPFVIGLIYVLVAAGNLLTTLRVVRQKFSPLSSRKISYLHQKYNVSPQIHAGKTE